MKRNNIAHCKGRKKKINKNYTFLLLYVTQVYFVRFISGFTVNDERFGLRNIVYEVQNVLEHFPIEIFTVQLKQIELTYRR